MSTPVEARGNGAAAREESARGDTGRVVATLERIAALHADLAAAYREMAVGFVDIQLAESPPSSLMDAVPTATPTPGPGPELLTVEDLAARLRVSSKTIRRWRNEGRLPDAFEVAGCVRWRAADVEEWLS